MSDITEPIINKDDIDHTSEETQEIIRKRTEERLKIERKRNEQGFFTKAGNFVRGKSRSGKTFYKVAGTTLPVIGTVFGFQTDFTHLTQPEDTMTIALAIEILGLTIEQADILSIIAALLLTISAYLGVKAKELGEQLAHIIKTVSKAISEDSEDGREISDAEKEEIWNEVVIFVKLAWLKFGRSWVARKLFKFDLVSEEEIKRLEG